MKTEYSMRKKIKDPIYFNVDELFPIEDDIKKQEKEFVKRFIEKSKVNISDEDQIYVIPNQEFIYLLSIVIREYETFRLTNPLN